MKKILKEFQSIYDLIMVKLGGFDRLESVFKTNPKIKLDSDNTGKEIILPKLIESNKVVDSFKIKEHEIATASNQGEGIGNMIIGVDFGVEPDQEGINIWAIEDDFIVQPNN